MMYWHKVQVIYNACFVTSSVDSRKLWMRYNFWGAELTLFASHDSSYETRVLQVLATATYYDCVIWMNSLVILYNMVQFSDIS